MSDPDGAGMLLTGDQIAGVRTLVGLRTEADLAHAAGVDLPTVMRAEVADAGLARIPAEAMAAIVRALEFRGAQFSTGAGRRVSVSVGNRR